MKVTFTCGRMNPPTLGHQRLIEEVKRVSEERGGEMIVFSTRTYDRDRNPLEASEKRDFIERAFGVPVWLSLSPYRALEEVICLGGRELVLIVGQDRIAGFAPMVAYAASLGVDLTVRSIDRETGSPSATQARRAALTGDRASFGSLIPQPDEAYEDDLYRAVRRGLTGDECQK